MAPSFHARVLCGSSESALAIRPNRPVPHFSSIRRSRFASTVADAHLPPTPQALRHRSAPVLLDDRIDRLPTTPARRWCGCRHLIRGCHRCRSSLDARNARDDPQIGKFHSARAPDRHRRRTHGTGRPASTPSPLHRHVHTGRYSVICTRSRARRSPERRCCPSWLPTPGPGSEHVRHPWASTKIYSCSRTTATRLRPRMVQRPGPSWCRARSSGLEVTRP